jgi:hypothetical protein
MKKLFILMVIGTLVSCSDGTTTGRKITKQELGNSWPFSVDEGIIGCENSAIYFEANDKKYPINGVAKSIYMNDINEIWLLDDELNKIEKTQMWRKDLSKILELGKAECK